MMDSKTVPPTGQHRLWMLPLLVSIFSIGGCSSLNARTPGVGFTVAEAQPEIDEHVKSIATETGPVAVKADNESSSLSPAPLSKETLYDLLVAEIAGKRQVFDVAQEKYAAQAKITQDSGIAARATRIALYRQDYINAKASAELWQALAPKDPYAQQALAEIYLYEQQWGLFSKAMNRMLALDTDMRMEFILDDLSHLDDQGKQQLLQTLSQVQHQHPTQPELMFVLAHLSQRAHQSAAALEQINRLLSVDPEHYPSYLFKARLLALDTPKEAIEFLSKTLKTRFKTNKALNMLYARLLIKAQRYQEAEAVFSHLAHVFPKDSSFHLSLGLLYLERKYYEGAKTAFQRLVEQNQRLDEAHFYLGRILDTEKQHNQALHHLFLVVSGKEFLPAQNLIAQILEAQGKVPQARLHLAHMRSQHPEHAPTLYIIEADVLSRQGQFPEAFELLGTALDATPDHLDLRYTRAMLAEKLDRLDVLEADLRIIIDRNPDNAAALNALGYTLADRTDRSKEALQLIKRARELDPDDPAIIDSLGWVYYRLGDLPKAVALLKEAYESFPDHEVAAHLGEVLWMLGEQEEAKLVWQKGLKLDPSSPILKETLQRLTGDEAVN